ncbi:MAG: prephenate dehydrogenase/arogenate dehydrogenase family protein [Methylococcales bacterium]|nr:prephenate dehydrogenase/arogenate dehydrogenase family protein [Methylococcales bacterium]
MFDRLCIVGCGLIGGSIARAARSQGLCREIVALGREVHLPELMAARRLGVVDDYYTSPGQALERADCVIIATPVGAVRSVFEQLAPFWNNTTVYSDACSTKASVVAAAQAVFGKAPANFVPAHPIAGAERSGVEASSAELFNNRRLIITPLADTDAAALDAIRRFWEQMGSTVAVMSVEHHDTVLAATSHLPHILAFALAGLLGRQDEQREIFKYAAGGFKDFSRIASSDPTMWLDICLANKQEIMPLIRQYRAELSRIEQMLADDQAQQLFETFAYARDARQRFLDQLED